MGLTDGLGFEEVNQSGLSTNLIQGVSGAFTRASATNYVGATATVTGNVSAGSFVHATGSAGFTGTVSGIEFLNGIAVAGP